jgi:hypothetical protein
MAPKRSGVVLTALIRCRRCESEPCGRERRLPSIGVAFNASQTALDLIAVGYSLGLAASVLYLGARPRAGGDRGRRAGGVRAQAASGQEPAVRPRHSREADVLGGGVRRDHRLRLPDGGDVRLAAVPAERAFHAGAAILPAAFAMVAIAPRSAKLVEARGARFTLLLDYAFCLLGFLAMLLLWKDGIPYWKVGLAYAFIGVGVGFAGTPASHSLTGSVPVSRAGMASGTADLQRDLGGAVMQSIFGALLTAGYAAAASAAIASAPNSKAMSDSVANQLTKSFGSARDVAQQHPRYASQITAAAKTSFLQGDDWAYTAGIVAILIGAAVVFFLFPRKEREQQLLASYAGEDAPERTSPPGPVSPAPAPAWASPKKRSARHSELSRSRRSSTRRGGGMLSRDCRFGPK